MFIAETDHVHWQLVEPHGRRGEDRAPRPQAVFGMPAFDYYAKHPAEGEQFGRAMENVSSFAAPAVLEAYDFAGVDTRHGRRRRQRQHGAGHSWERYPR